MNVDLEFGIFKMMLNVFDRESVRPHPSQTGRLSYISPVLAVFLSSDILVCNWENVYTSKPLKCQAGTRSECSGEKMMAFIFFFS